ncbi:MAG: LUD domain-containing protein [Bacteroidota bacterium]
MSAYDTFIKATETATANKELAPRMDGMMQRYEQQLNQARSQYANLKLARERAAYYKWKVLESLDKYLIDFEAAVMRRGGKVLWAVDAEAACNEVESILKRVQPQCIVKSKSMLTDEIELNAFLRKHNYTVLETDVGEFVVDMAAEKPFHMVTPAMHKTKEEIAALLNDKIGVSMDADAEHIVEDIRTELRSRFTQSDVLITGANFLIADSGMVAITENEGNTRMGMAFAKTHIVLAGIDKLIPSLNDLDVFFPLLATFGTGQKLTSYNSITGPRQATDLDGPAEFIVVLIDNGRSNVLAQPDQRQALSCIKCGACSNVCPVFKTIGGHAYGVSNAGPVGAVVVPHMQGMDAYKHLSYASPLCGRCTDICPVNIDLHNHLTRNRRDSVNQGFTKSADKLMWFSWKKMMLSRKNLNKGVSIKNFMLKSFFKTSWGERREFPRIADKSFNQLWRERLGV